MRINNSLLFAQASFHDWIHLHFREFGCNLNESWMVNFHRLSQLASWNVNNDSAMSASVKIWNFPSNFFIAMNFSWWYLVLMQPPSCTTSSWEKTFTPPTYWHAAMTDPSKARESSSKISKLKWKELDFVLTKLNNLYEW